MQSAWGTGYVADFQVKSASGAKAWSVTWSDPTVTAVTNAWGMTCTVTVRTSITCTGAGWASTIAAGQSVWVGLQVEATRAPAAPTLILTAR